jgi:N-acetyl-anhydromuramyl-L-alanine amidase AmpD
MLAIQDIKILDKNNKSIKKRNFKKNQILLYDTKRKFNNFVNKLKYRRNGQYSDVPHFIVTKLGEIYQVIDTKYSSTTFNNSKIDNCQIKIAIENLGWLNKNTITGVLNNWIGEIYRSEPHIKTWRNHFFWDKYTETQIKSVSELCSFLCEKHNIPKKVIKSQSYFNSVSKFHGVVCKSNFSSIYNDINPSFDFDVLFNELTNGKK